MEIVHYKYEVKCFKCLIYYVCVPGKVDGHVHTAVDFRGLVNISMCVFVPVCMFVFQDQQVTYVLAFTLVM